MRRVRTTAEAVEFGRELLAAKQQIGHGYFLGYLKERGIGEDTARRWMLIAQQVEEIPELLDLRLSMAYRVVTTSGEHKAITASIITIKRQWRERDIEEAIVSHLQAQDIQAERQVSCPAGLSSFYHATYSSTRLARYCSTASPSIQHEMPSSRDLQTPDLILLILSLTHVSSMWRCSSGLFRQTRQGESPKQTLHATCCARSRACSPTLSGSPAISPQMRRPSARSKVPSGRWRRSGAKLRGALAKSDSQRECTASRAVAAGGG